MSAGAVINTVPPMHFVVEMGPFALLTQLNFFGEDWMEWEVDAHDSLRVSGIVSDKPAQENAI